jgi:hypothetical protein
MEFPAIEDTWQIANRGIHVESNKFNCRERLACADVKSRRVLIACYKNLIRYPVEAQRIELKSTTFEINCWGAMIIVMFFQGNGKRRWNFV